MNHRNHVGRRCFIAIVRCSFTGAAFDFDDVVVGADDIVTQFRLCFASFAFGS